MRVPEPLWKSWLHLVMSCALLASEFPAWQEHMTTALNLVDEGMQMMTRESTPYSLLDASILLPTEISSLVSLRLLKDMTGGQHDVLETYQQSMRGLVTSLLHSLRRERLIICEGKPTRRKPDGPNTPGEVCSPKARNVSHQ